MRNNIAVLTSASAALILGVAGAFASGSQYHTPSTDRARETQPLLARAAHAVNTSVGDAHISNLWVYPTADESFVFAQYDVTASSAPGAASQRHFELLKMQGDRIVESRDLNGGGNDGEGNQP